MASRSTWGTSHRGTPRSCASAARAPCIACRSRLSATGRLRDQCRRESPAARSLRVNPAERRAARWYRLRGWRILGANVRAGRNEIDLIARRGRRLRFVEVKEKTGPRFGDPAEMVTEEKQRRVRRAAQIWLQSQPELRGLEVAFDVVAVWEGRLRRIPDAF